MSGQREDCGGDCGSCRRCQEYQASSERQSVDEQMEQLRAYADMAARLSAVPRNVRHPELWTKAARYALAAAKLRLVFKREDADAKALLGASVKADRVGQMASDLYEEAMGREKK